MELQGRNLTIRMKGEDVKLLQSELKLLGYILPADEISRGYFGRETRNAVLSFQKQRGLQTTGIVDKHTAEQINAVVEASQAKEFIVQDQVFHPDS